MLQIQPEEEIILEFIRSKEYKYIRLLGLFYLRLTSNKPKDVYRILEPLYSDYRQVTMRETSG